MVNFDLLSRGGGDVGVFGVVAEEDQGVESRVVDHWSVNFVR
jgi:hypothetical protein